MVLATEEKVAPKVKIETVEQYLRKNFLRSEDEFQVDFNKVGENRYRINFWSSEKKKNETVADNKISRSFYVVLKKCGTERSHTIR